MLNYKQVNMTDQRLNELIKEMEYHMRGYQLNVDLDNETRAGIHQHEIKEVLLKLYSE